MAYCEIHKIEYPHSKDGCPKCWLQAKIKKWDADEMVCKVCDRKLGEHTIEQKRNCVRVLQSKPNPSVDAQSSQGLGDSAEDGCYHTGHKGYTKDHIVENQINKGEIPKPSAHKQDTSDRRDS